jgi:hypothetical protein
MKQHFQITSKYNDNGDIKQLVTFYTAESPRAALAKVGIEPEGRAKAGQEYSKANGLITVSYKPITAEEYRAGMASQETVEAEPEMPATGPVEEHAVTKTETTYSSSAAPVRRSIPDRSRGSLRKGGAMFGVR